MFDGVRDFFVNRQFSSAWNNRTGWLGVKHQVTCSAANSVDSQRHRARRLSRFMERGSEAMEEYQGEGRRRDRWRVERWKFGRWISLPNCKEGPNTFAFVLVTDICQGDIIFD